MVTTVSKHIGDKTIAVIGGLAILGLIAYFIFTRIGNNTSTTTNPSSTSQNPSLSSPSTSSASSSPTQSGASGNFLPNESNVAFSSPASELPSGGSIGLTSSNIIDSFNTTETYAPKNIVNNSTVNNSTTSSSIVTNNNQKTTTVNNQGGKIVKKKSTSSGTSTLPSWLQTSLTKGYIPLPSTKSSSTTPTPSIWSDITSAVLAPEKALYDGAVGFLKGFGL